MAQVILTADVENGAAWEAAFRSHGQLFRDNKIGTINYSVGADNHVVMCTDVDDVDGYLSFLKSAATQDAMKNDGVKRDTVRVTVLDRDFTG